jgi:alpha-beta hydrolase superfamily lysophospholipase
MKPQPWILRRRAGSSDKTVLFLDGMKHRLLHDEDYLTFGVINRIIGWMGQRSVTEAAE